MASPRSARALFALLSALAAPLACAQISLTALDVPYEQDFDTLASTGTTSDVVPAGWAFLETGGNANTTYGINNGSSNGGNTYSYGTTGSSDRAFGSLLSGSLQSRIGAQFQNNTGNTLSALDIAYTGEQWRQGGTNRCDRLEFEYSLDATGLDDGTWTAVPELDFEGVQCGPTGNTALDGNDPANRTDISHHLGGLGIANGETFWIRWVDFDAPGADDGLAVDDFTLIPRGAGGVLSLSIANAQAAEGDAGLSPMNFTVTLSGPAPTGGVDFTATTADDTATAPDDYIALVDAPFSIDEGETTGQVTVQIVGNTVVEPNKTFTVTIATSAAGVVIGNGTATGTILNDDYPELEIFEIQGDGPRSPYAPASGTALGDTVTTRNNAVTAIAGNGFFMQTPDDRDDNNPLTSNGLFVFTGSAPSVAVGDRVDVTGRVQEFFDWTQLSGSPTVTVIGTGPLPTAIVFDENLPSTDPDALSCGFSNFECFENMLVEVPAGHLVTGNQTFGSDPFAENFVSFGAYKARREKGLRFGLSVPGRPELPAWDGNPEVMELDADALGAVPPDTGINGGGMFSATGVVTFEFGNHELWPITLDLVETTLPRPVPEPLGSEELRIGSFNVENLCSQGCGDPAPSPADFALKLARLSDYIGNVLLLPDVVGLQEVEFDDSVEALVDRIELDHGLRYDFYTGVGNDPREIRNAYLVNPARIAVDNVEDLGADETIDQCSGTPPCAKHDRPPVLLQGRFIAGDDEPFAVMVVHNRSLSGILNTGASGQRVRFKRFAQASSIAGFVQELQTSVEPVADRIFASNFELQVPLIVLGDFNAFEVTDGLVDMVGLIAGTYEDDENEFQLQGPNLVNPPLHNLVLDLDLDERYSYSFRENLGNIQGQSPRQVASIQVLDHGLIDQAGLSWCPELHYGRGNADAPARLRAIGTGAVASSDHDGFVIGLLPAAASQTVSPLPDGVSVCTVLRATGNTE